MADGTLLRRTQSRQLNSGDHVIVGVDVTEGNSKFANLFALALSVLA